MTDSSQTVAAGTSKESVFSETAQKNGGSAETGRQGKSSMLQVAEKPERAKLLTKVGSEFVTASPDKKAAEWLEGHIAKSQDKITTVLADLTPALARVLLNRNEGNRKISETVVAAYARDMTNGAWQFNGEPIIVAKDGHLIDGQHRCDAVVFADTAISAIYVFGVEREAQTTIDQGKLRSIGDYLSMRGHIDVNHLGAAARFCLQYANYGRMAMSGNEQPTKSEMLEFVGQHTGLANKPDLVTSLNVVSRKGANAVGGKSVLAFVHFTLWGRSGKANADAFADALIGGSNLSAKNPILYIRNRLINERGGRFRPAHKVELIFKAWNAWRRNEAIHRFEVSGGKLPKLEK